MRGETLDDTQFIDVTNATVSKICHVVTLFFSRMTKAKRSQEMSMVGEVVNVQPIDAKSNFIIFMNHLATSKSGSSMRLA